MAPRAIGAGPPETGFNMYPRHTRANPHIPAETMRRGFVGARQTVHHVTNLPKAPSGLIRAGEVGVGAAAVGGGAVAARKLYRKRKAEPVTKSAFGVDHGIEKAIFGGVRRAAAMTEHLSSSAHRSAMQSARVDAMKANANLGTVGGAHRVPSRGPRHAVDAAKKSHRGTAGLAVGAAAGLAAPTGVRQAKARLTPVSV